MFRRALVVVAALSTAVVGFAMPATASSHDSCVVESGEFNAIRASLMPTTMIEEDVAYNHDDPDAEDNPLALIRFPDETALWISARVASSDSIVGASYPSASSDSQFAFQGPERSDRPVSDSIVRLYCGLLDRKPSSLELEYWAARYWNGLPLVTIAEAFTHSREFVNIYGVVSDEALVTLLYTQVLGRAPGAGAVDAVNARIDAGEIHRGHAVVQITESGEYVRRTGTVAPEKPILPYPDEGSGRRIIYTNGGQRVWLINDTGELHKTHQVSGRRGIPSVGRYRIYSMSRYAWAPYDGITMEYMVRFARGEWPYGFHSIPVHPNDAPMQTPAQLGTHRSGGCVRQLWDDAQAVYEWSTIGTRVIVTP
jgi:lipoprotein-anchoring transpeptidase ErfK/SrfK